jgi:hypothetical protein
MSIKLTSPITINVPSIKKSDGTIKEFAPVVMNEIDFIVTYDNSRKFASAIIKGVNRNITLWSGDAYDKAGQFTDKDVDARVNEILGSDPVKAIEALFQPATKK